MIVLAGHLRSEASRAPKILHSSDSGGDSDPAPMNEPRIESVPVADHTGVADERIATSHREALPLQ